MRIAEQGPHGMIYRDATLEEVAMMNESQPEPSPSLEDQVAELQEQLAAAKILLGIE